MQLDVLLLIGTHGPAGFPEFVMHLTWRFTQLRKSPFRMMFGQDSRKDFVLDGYVGIVAEEDLENDESVDANGHDAHSDTNTDTGAMTLQNIDEVLVVSDVGLQASTVSNSCQHVLLNSITLDHDYSIHSVQTSSSCVGGAQYCVQVPAPSQLPDVLDMSSLTDGASADDGGDVSTVSNVDLHNIQKRARVHYLADAKQMKHVYDSTHKATI